MHPIRTLTCAAAAIALTTSLAACSSGDSDDAGDQATDSASQEAGGAEAEEDRGAEGSAEAAGFDMENMPEPVASEDIPAVVEGDPDATMTVDFYGLHREGKTVVGQFAFTVNANGGEGEDWLYGYLGRQSWEPFLVDSQNLRKHSVLKGANNSAKAQTNYQGPKFAPGQTYYAFAVFAAPPNDVQEVQVSAVDGMNLVQGVKIQ